MNAPPTQFQNSVSALAVVWLSETRNAFDGQVGQLSVGVESNGSTVRFASNAVGYPSPTSTRSALDSRCPFGKAKIRWTKTARESAPAATPSVNGSDEFA